MRQISSAMSVGVTEPNSEPVGPDLTSKRSTVLPSTSAMSVACSALRASWRPRCSSRLRSSATRAGRGLLGQPAREQEVAGVAAGDVDDLAAQPDLLDVAQEDDFHQFVTYGSSAISRARLTATETWLWWRRQVPVIRRERILPFSET